MKRITLAELHAVVAGANGLVRVKAKNGKWMELGELTFSEMKRLPVVKVVGTEYPNYPNVIEVTVDWKAYINS